MPHYDPVLAVSTTTAYLDSTVIPRQGENKSLEQDKKTAVKPLLREALYLAVREQVRKNFQS